MKRQFSNNSGQVMPYFLAMTVVLVICWAMILNIGKLLIDRMIAQNAADNAAMSVAVYKARVLNTLGLLNYVIGCSLYGSKNGLLSYHEYGAQVSGTGWKVGLPLPVWPMGGFPADYNPPGKKAVDNQQKIASTLDMSGIGNGSLYVKVTNNFVKMMVLSQDIIMKPFETNVPIQLFSSEIAKRQDNNNLGADSTIILQGINLGLERNKNGTKYYKSKKMKSLIPVATKKLINFAVNVLLKIPVSIKDIYKAKFWKRENNSWLYADKDSFHKHQKIIIITEKSNSSKSGYPIFGTWIGIKWPNTKAISAAGLYNGKGSMFPLEQNKFPSNKISPVIKEYLKAEDGGWNAHLVPVGSPYKH